jgi:transcriptional regulator with XRE-family HTH domain
LGSIVAGVTKSVFTKRYQLFLSMLVSARQEKGLSQRDVAKRLKKIQSYVSKYERGERRLDVIEFLDVAKVLDADPHAIIETSRVSAA